ncbi:PKD domain-containing protein [Bacteroidota bacterium]
MKNFSLLLLLGLLYTNIIAQNTYFSETFDSAFQTGWTIEVASGDSTIDNWRFENVGNREIGQTISGAPQAIFDDAYNTDTIADTIDLISPPVNLVGKNNSSIFFVQYFEGGFGGKGEIWTQNDLTSDWVKIYEISETSPANPDKMGVDIQNTIQTGDDARNFRVKFRWIGKSSFWWVIDDMYIYGTVSGDAAGISSDNLPRGCVVSNENPLNFTIKNLGTNQMSSLIFNYQLNNDTVFSEQVSFPLNVEQNTTYTHTFSKNPVFKEGKNNIKLWTSNPNGSTDGFPVNDTIYLTTDLSKLQVVNLPFEEDFEDTLLHTGFCYSYGPSENGRIYLADTSYKIKPLNGNISLVMDSYREASTIDAVDILVNLSSCVDKILSFKYSGINESTENEDGLFISVDNGISFNKIYDFNFENIDSGEIIEVSLNLDSIANILGITLTDKSLLRWRHAGNNTIQSGNDGFMLDDIFIDIKNRQVSDAIVSEIANPMNEIYIDSSFNLSVYVKNNIDAVDTLVAAKISYTFQDTSISEFWGGCLPPGDSMLFTFSNELKTHHIIDTFPITVWIEMPESNNMIDFNHYNDTTTKEIAVLCSPVKANFTATNLCFPENSIIKSTSKYATEWKWYLNDSLLSLDTNVLNVVFDSIGTYRIDLKVRDNKGCTDSSSRYIEINSKPTAGFDFTDACLGEENKFTNLSSNADSIIWKFGDFSQSKQVEEVSHVYNIPGIYPVTQIVKTVEGCSDTLKQNVNVFELPVANAGIDTLLVCNQKLTVVGSAILGKAPYSFYWSNGIDSAQNDSLTPGTYILRVTDSNTCIAFDTLNIGLTGTNLQLSVSKDTTVCFGDMALLTAVADSGVLPYTYTWLTGDTTTQIMAKADSLPYAVTVEDSVGCKITKNIMVYQTELLSVNLGEDKTVCYQDSILIEAVPEGGSGKYTFSWNSGDSIASVYVDSGNYVVTVTDEIGCTATDSIYINEDPQLLVTLPQDTLLCKGEKMLINANPTGGDGNYQYLWNTGDTSKSINHGEGTIIVELNDGINCTASDTMNIAPGVWVDLGKNKVVQCGETANVDAIVTGGDSNYEYLWNTGDTVANLDSLWPGIYTLTVTDGIGCSYTDDIQIILFNTDFNLELDAKAEICKGDTASLIPVVTGGTLPYTFKWSTGATDSLIKTSIGAIYKLTVQDSAKCIRTDSIHVKVSDMQINTKDLTLCVNNSVILQPDISNGISPYRIIWENNDTVNTITVMDPGFHKFKVQDAIMCEIMDSIEVISSSIKLVLPDTGTLCNEGTVEIKPLVLSGSEPISYSWSNGSVTSSIIVDTIGTYSLEITDSNNCIAKDTIEIIPTEIKLILPEDRVICNGKIDTIEPIEVTGAGTIVYNWSNNANTSSIVTNNAGVYSLAITDSNNCAATDTIELLTSTVKLKLPEDRTLCEGENYTITPVELGGNDTIIYKWSDRSSSSSLTVESTGVYTLEITDADNCSAKDTIELIASSVNLELPGDKILCAGENFTISPLKIDGKEPLVYKWNDNSISSSLNILNSGIYTLEITDADNCKARDTIEIFASSITLLLPEDKILCKGNNFTIVPLKINGEGNILYNWINGSTSSSITVETAGTYSLEITDANNCKASDEIIINMSQLTADFDMSKTEVFVNVDNTVKFTNKSSGASSFSWNFGNGLTSELKDPETNYTKTGTYTIELAAMDDNNCIEKATKQIAAKLTSAIQNELLSSIKIYPVPAKEELFIELPESKISEIRIELYNILGNLIYQNTNLTSSIISLYVSNIVPGMYILRICEGNDCIFKELIVK